MHPSAAIITVETPMTPMFRDAEDLPRPAKATADSFLGSAGENDDDDSYVGAGGLGEHSPDTVGESLADISNSDFFNFTQDLNDEFCSTDLF